MRDAPALKEPCKLSFSSRFVCPPFLSLSSNVNIFVLQVCLKGGAPQSVPFARNGKQEGQRPTGGCGHQATDDTWLGRLCPWLPVILGEAHVTNKTSQNV